MGAPLWWLVGTLFTVTPGLAEAEPGSTERTVRVIGKCGFDPWYLRNRLLLESQGRLKVVDRSTAHYTIRCSGNQVEVIQREPKTLLRRHLFTSPDPRARARALALSIAELLAEPEPPPRPRRKIERHHESDPDLEPSPEPSLPEPMSEPMPLNSSLRMSLNGFGVVSQSGDRLGGGVSGAIGWRPSSRSLRLDGELSGALLRESIGSSQLRERQLSVSLRALGPSWLSQPELRGGVGLRGFWASLDASDPDPALRSRRVEALTYGPLVFLGAELNPRSSHRFTAGLEFGWTLNSQSADIDEESIDVFSGGWLRISLGWSLDV
ncbi:MAG: hypothetical protein AAFP04_02080 [Myxococcota bacterium]